jgi:hypothetical protein
VEKPRLY